MAAPRRKRPRATRSRNALVGMLTHRRHLAAAPGAAPPTKPGRSTIGTGFMTGDHAVGPRCAWRYADPIPLQGLHIWPVTPKLPPAAAGDPGGALAAAVS